MGRGIEAVPESQPVSPDIEELKAGTFSLSPSEIERIRTEAKASGQDPDTAVAQKQAKIDQANARLRDEQSEKASDLRPKR